MYCLEREVEHERVLAVLRLTIARLGIIANQFCLETECVVYHLNHLLQAESVELRTLIQAS